MGKVTTHVLDTASGKPASKVRIVLYRADSNKVLADVATNEDGRCDSPLLTDDNMKEGQYRIDFHVGQYFTTCDTVPFLDIVPVNFGINDPDAHYHIPLLISPFGYSTYRGS